MGKGLKALGQPTLDCDNRMYSKHLQEIYLPISVVMAASQLTLRYRSAVS